MMDGLEYLTFWQSVGLVAATLGGTFAFIVCVWAGVNWVEHITRTWR